MEPRLAVAKYKDSQLPHKYPDVCVLSSCVLVPLTTTLTDCVCVLPREEGQILPPTHPTESIVGRLQRQSLVEPWQQPLKWAVGCHSPKNTQLRDSSPLRLRLPMSLCVREYARVCVCVCVCVCVRLAQPRHGRLMRLLLFTGAHLRVLSSNTRAYRSPIHRPI